MFIIKFFGEVFMKKFTSIILTFTLVFNFCLNPCKAEESNTYLKKQSENAYLKEYTEKIKNLIKTKFDNSVYLKKGLEKIKNYIEDRKKHELDVEQKRINEKKEMSEKQYVCEKLKNFGKKTIIYVLLNVLIFYKIVQTELKKIFSESEVIENAKNILLNFRKEVLAVMENSKGEINFKDLFSMFNTTESAIERCFLIEISREEK